MPDAVAQRVIGQVYPWDLADDPRRARSWVAAGVAGVAVAVNYHAVRAIRWQEDGAPRVIQQDASAHHLPIRDRVWAGRALRPRPPIGLPDDLFAQAMEVAREAGLVPSAWFAATHVDGAAPGDVRPFAVVDAWGNRSAYALCPSWPEVRAYGRGIIEDVVRETGVTSFLVESISAPGFGHSVAHDKSEFAAIDARMARDLSLCFCAACAERVGRAGRDPDRESALIRHLFADRPRGDEVDEVVARRDVDRAGQVLDFVEEMALPVGGRPIELTVAATADLGARGAFAPVTRKPVPALGLCIDLSAPDGRGRRDLESWSSWPDVRRCGTMALTGPGSALDMLGSARSDLSASTPLDDLYLYHLGLFPPRRLDELDIPALTRT